MRFPTIWYVRPAKAQIQSAHTRSLTRAFASRLFKYSMTVKLLIEHNFELLSLKGVCTGSSEYFHVKMPHRWSSIIYRFVSCCFAIIQRSGGEQELTCRK